MNYLLTNPQKSIWLTEKVYSGTSINNISGYTYIDEDIKFDVLKKAINEVIKLNDSMRIKIEEAQKIESSLVRDEEGLISIEKSIGIYAPDENMESVLFGKKGYYEN